MLIVTINEVPGKKMEALGVVQGSTVQSRTFGHDIMAGFRTLGRRSHRLCRDAH